MRVESQSAAETQALAERLARAVAADQTPFAILLQGDYGCGKTTFVQGLARGLGITEEVRSPSYLILRLYEEGRRPLLHADLYRSAGAADIEELGLLELLPVNGIIAAEWPGEQLARLLSLPTLSISFGLVEDENSRVLELNWTADLPGPLQEALHAAAAG
jgi:tRNA threonylcarbamoyladenosine biosynthesis protein TsaE